MIIDLSHPLYDHMPAFEGYAALHLKHSVNYETTGYYSTLLSMDVHAGTHIDAGAHTLKGGNFISDYPIDRFIGKAFVANVSTLDDKNEITVSALSQYEHAIINSPILLLATGWSQHFGSKEFFTEFPGIAPDVPAWIAEKGVKLIGIETPAVHTTYHKKVHDELFKNNIPVIESLNGLDKLCGKVVDFFAVPLLLKNSEASPVRAFAFENINQKGERL